MDQMEVLNLVHQVVVEYKEEVEALEHLILEILIQEIRMTHLHQMDGDVEVRMHNQQIKLVVEVVALAMEVVQVLKVVMVFNYHLHLEIQMDSNMITSQITHLDLVQLLVGL